MPTPLVIRRVLASFRVKLVPVSASHRAWSSHSWARGCTTWLALTCAAPHRVRKYALSYRTVYTGMPLVAAPCTQACP